MSQSSSFLENYYFSNYGGTNHYILDKELVHTKYGSEINLFINPYQGAIVYVQEPSDSFLISFVLDPSWNKLVYGVYSQEWVKIYGKYSTGSDGWYHPRSVATDGLGNIYVADTHNSRIVKLEYDSVNEEIDPGSFATIGEGILDQPWDLDVDDRGNLDPSDDIIWVVDNGLGQVIPLNLDGTMWGNGSIEYLYNPSNQTYYWDLTGLCGIAVRKSAAQGYNSTSNRRLYLADWKLRRVFLVESESIEDGQGLIYKEKGFNSSVLISGVESDYFGDVWVVDNAGERVKKYTWDLDYLDELTGLNRPTSVASVRRHHVNMAITERWTNSTGNRTYSQGANIRNLVITPGASIVNIQFCLTNTSKLTVQIDHWGTGVETLASNATYSSGHVTFNWYAGVTSGSYGLQIWARSWEDEGVYRHVNEDFAFPLQVTITGPTELPQGYVETWSAHVEGNTGAVSYQWYEDCSGAVLGTEASQSYALLPGEEFITLRVVVYDGAAGAEDTHEVRVEGDPVMEKRFVLPQAYSLSQNLPNPFNALTAMRYALPEASVVTLIIYDILGREVKVLVAGYEEPGYKEVMWDGSDQSGRAVSSGVYIYQMIARSSDGNEVFKQTHKMAIVK